MQIRNFNSRLERIESQLNPKLNLLMVITKKGESVEEAKLRVMREHGLEVIPEDVLVYVINVFGSV